MTSAPHLVVFTGSGISAESGIQTFRASDGLWEDHPVEEVATPQGWRQDPERVLAFYNQRRDQIRRAKPNAAHKALAALEQEGFRVSVVTQNIDDLHERAGSRHVLHLHGEILKARSSVDARLRYPLPKGGIRLGEVCDKGSQLRPDVVWFGEAVPLFEEACELVSQADFLLVVGTSLAVMPAASSAGPWLTWRCARSGGAPHPHPVEGARQRAHGGGQGEGGHCRVRHRPRGMPEHRRRRRRADARRAVLQPLVCSHQPL